MMYISSILHKHFAEYKNLDVQTKKKMQYIVLRYLFRACTSTQMTRTLRKYLGVKVNSKKFRLDLISRGYIVNLKLYLYACVYYEIYDDRVMKLADLYHVHKRDAGLIKLLQGKPLQSKLRSYCFMYECLTYEQYKRRMERIVYNVETYLKKGVNKKLRFIMNSNSIQLHDFTMDLLEKGLQTCLMMYPCFKSKQHMVNQVKHAVKFKIVNIIEEWTRKKRATLYTTKDGQTQSYKVPLHAVDKSGVTSLAMVSSITGSNSTIDKTIVGSMENELDLSLSIEKIKETCGPKNSRLVDLLMGKNDPDFTKWLKDRNYLRSSISHNDDYQEYLIKNHRIYDYIDLALEFLGIDREKGYNTIQSFGNIL